MLTPKKMLVSWILILSVDLVICSPPSILEHPSSIAVGKEDPATLRCQVEGEPVPEVFWMKDGEVVPTAPKDKSSHRVLLPAGSLFFLRVEQNKRVDDTGTYWCVARNSEGEVASKKANLNLAYLKNKFEMEPLDTWVVKGGDVSLPCQPPVGFPTPSVEWTKNEQPIDLTDVDRYQMSGGNLIILKSRQSDQGVYQCIASNVAAFRSSHRANLAVYEKPYFIKAPENKSVDQGSPVDLSCIAGGHPPPDIVWKGPQGPLDYRGSLLQIKQVSLVDSGEYTCEVENIAGNSSAHALITVHNPPKFRESPTDERVIQDSSAVMKCAADSAATQLYWIREGVSQLIEPVSRTQDGDKQQQKFYVDSAGQLVVHRVDFADEGYYFCLLISESGSNIASGKLTLRSSLKHYPPIIELGPVNKTVSRDDDVRLNCRFATRDVDIKVKWLKDGLPIELLAAGHFSLVDGNNLLISGSTESDSGVYTCQIKTGSGLTSASASVTVLPKDKSVDQLSTDLLDFPASPGKPRMLDSTNSSLTVGWSKPRRVGSSPLRGYQVEYFIPGESNHWVSMEVQEESVTVEHLSTVAPLVFLVRARNDHGLSPPSLLSDPIRLYKGKENKGAEALVQKLSGKLIEWNLATPLSSSKVELSWKVVSMKKSVEGYYLYVWKKDNLAEIPLTILISGGTTTSQTLSKLLPNTEYTAFLLPHSRTVVGRPSNLIAFRTKETVPDQPPLNLELKLMDPSTAVASWSTPHLNLGAHITGFKVEILTNNTLVGNFTLDPGSTSLILNNLTTGFIYSVKIAAFNRAGLGPYSDTVSLKVEPSLLFNPAIPSHPGGSVRNIHETWFVSFIGTFSILTILAASILVYLHRRNSIRKHYTQYSVGESKMDNGSLACMESDTMWINPKANVLSMYGTYQDKPTHLYINSVYPPEYAELQQTNQKISNPDPADTNLAEYKKKGQDSSRGQYYASTDLMEQSFNKSNGLMEDRPGADDHSGSTGETTTGSSSSGSRKEPMSSVRKNLAENLQTSQRSLCEELKSTFHPDQQKVCYSVGNSPYRRIQMDSVTGGQAVPPAPPSRGLSSYHSVRGGAGYNPPGFLNNLPLHSLTSFNSDSLDAGDAKSKSTDLDLRLSPGKQDSEDQYESASTYLPLSAARPSTLSTLSTAFNPSFSLYSQTSVPSSSINHSVSMSNSDSVHRSNISTDAKMSRLQSTDYQPYLVDHSADEDSFYDQSNYEESPYEKTTQYGEYDCRIQNQVNSSSSLHSNEKIYSTFKPLPPQTKVPKRKMRMERRLSESGTRRPNGLPSSLKEKLSKSTNSSPALNRRRAEDNSVYACEPRASESMVEVTEIKERYM